MASSTAGAGGLPVPPRAEESVKVVVRIRPLSQQEQEDGRRVCVPVSWVFGLREGWPSSFRPMCLTD